jgi:hypothetical protein
MTALTLAARQSSALFIDAYRELNARKLFWITIALSVLVVGAFAAVGLNERGISFLWWTIPNDYLNTKWLKPELLYKFAYANIAIPIWLAWAATILALVTTAGIIPEFLAGGAIELSLSKPIGRWRLFLTKYLTGLLFTALQVGLFSAAAFLVIGIRGHAWEPRLFWAIPLMVAFYSYLFCVCVLLGVLTRSTIAALLLTLLFWLFVFGVNTTEQTFLLFREVNTMRIERLDGEIESLKAKQARQQELLRPAPAGEPAAAPDQPGEPGQDRPSIPPITEAQRAGAQLAIDKTAADMVERQRRLEDVRSNRSTLQTGHRICMAVKTVLPKTSETVKLLDRFLLSREDLDKLKPRSDETFDAGGGRRRGENDLGVSQRALERRMEEALRSRTLGWVLGTSLAFELVILGLAGVLFARRDF